MHLSYSLCTIIDCLLLIQIHYSIMTHARLIPVSIQMQNVIMTHARLVPVSIQMQNVIMTHARLVPVSIQMQNAIMTHARLAPVCPDCLHTYHCFVNTKFSYSNTGIHWCTCACPAYISCRLVYPGNFFNIILQTLDLFVWICLSKHSNACQVINNNTKVCL